MTLNVCEKVPSVAIPSVALAKVSDSKFPQVANEIIKNPFGMFYRRVLTCNKC